MTGTVLGSFTMAAFLCLTYTTVRGCGAGLDAVADFCDCDGDCDCWTWKSRSVGAFSPLDFLAFSVSVNVIIFHSLRKNFLSPPFFFFFPPSSSKLVSVRVPSCAITTTTGFLTPSNPFTDPALNDPLNFSKKLGLRLGTMVPSPAAAAGGVESVPLITCGLPGRTTEGTGGAGVRTPGVITMFFILQYVVTSTGPKCSTTIPSGVYVTLTLEPEPPMGLEKISGGIGGHCASFSTGIAYTRPASKNTHGRLSGVVCGGSGGFVCAAGSGSSISDGLSVNSPIIAAVSQTNTRRIASSSSCSLRFLSSSSSFFLLSSISSLSLLSCSSLCFLSSSSFCLCSSSLLSFSSCSNLNRSSSSLFTLSRSLSSSASLSALSFSILSSSSLFFCSSSSFSIANFRSMSLFLSFT
eukprot:comp23298_c0_seq1/m.38243 comp23298_c0_seq1/g.38243  ORF comp23298_c0_seq1/g.38243 comp23298_c0_seq1/m.38243 type:complete len:409 (+) comp23298_c0_seq1:584-1810(+)